MVRFRQIKKKTNLGCLEVHFEGYINKMPKMFLLQYLHHHIFCGGDMLPKELIK